MKASALWGLITSDT